jgi:hypothetical protein
VVPPAPAVTAPPAAAARAAGPADDAGDLAIPDDFGPESWDDTLDLPQPATDLTLPDDDTDDTDADTDDTDAEDAPDDDAGLPEELLPDEFGDEPEDEDGDTLAGVVEHADWESLLTGLDDDEDEGAEPVYVVEDGPATPAPAPRATAEVVAPPRDAVQPAPSPPAAPTGREPVAPAGDPALAGTPGEGSGLDDLAWPGEDEDGGQLPPLGTLDDVLHDEPGDEPLPALGELADDDDAPDDPGDEDGPLVAFDEPADDDAALTGPGMPDDDEPPVALDEPDEEPVTARDEDGDEHPAGFGTVPLTAAALAAASRQPATGAGPPAGAPEPWADRPAWPPEPEPAPRGRWLYGVGSLLLALALVAQIVTHQRDELATHPEWGPLVRNVYARLGMDVYPAWDLGAYEVRGSEAVAGRSSAGALDIVARLAVVGEKPVGLPLVRVTLRDRRGDVLGQRVVAATEYLPADAALTEPVGPGTLIPVEVSLPDPGVDASGYEVDICLLTRAQGLVCQAEREPFQR